MFCEALKQFIVIVQGVDAHRSYRSVSAGIAVSAREVWWPTLRLLQQATSSRSTPEAAEQIRLLLGSWTALGAALNLDVAAERQRHERDARRRCAWRECQFHQQALPQNMHTELRTCSGCHDIRYCSRRCQKRCVNLTGNAGSLLQYSYPLLSGTGRREVTGYSAGVQCNYCVANSIGSIVRLTMITHLPWDLMYRRDGKL